MAVTAAKLVLGATTALKIFLVPFYWVRVTMVSNLYVYYGIGNSANCFSLGR